MMKRLHLLAGLVLALATESCAPTGPGQGANCQEPAPTGVRCCDAGTYKLVSVTDLARASSDYLGQRVEAVGVADWFPDSSGSSGCVCADNMCSCAVPLALRSAACGDRILLGGQYRGRAVECSDAGCYPLTVPNNYRVCGPWMLDQGSTSLTPVLTVEVVCDR